MGTDNQIRCAYCKALIQSPTNSDVMKEHACEKLIKARGASYFIAVGGGSQRYDRFGTPGRDYTEASVEPEE